MSRLIAFEEVVKSYPIGEKVLFAANHLNFTIDEGEFVIILGPSGAGKSTLLNLLGGMDHVTSGKIVVGEREISELKAEELSEYRAEDVGFVFQFYNLIPALTVYENVALVKEIARESLDPGEMLQSVGLLEHQDKFPAQLSGGEQQRVSIARAVCKNPKMLLCDEPTGALDSETGILILSLLQNMSREHNRTVIIVTHNSALAEAADKVIRIKNGKIRSVTVNENPKSVSEVEW
ncbi:ABC transporter ATP-binding protein [Robinsoniella sp. KNHs210]|uniref:ABC transporter ATP-binding protein n=1 Tax=Robinsoniella sp. KNHs210 TaxID=1469950 RepID=UPI000487F465|nr:ABC transporter ATP-binding protein [Robinsoniella sp. KNHs210]